MRAFTKRCAVVAALFVALAAATAPAQAGGKIVFGDAETLRDIQDVNIRGPNGEPLYLGYKFTEHAFILPYGMTDDGYILGVRGLQRYFPLDEAKIKSLQSSGQLPKPLPPYQISTGDYILGHFLWIWIAIIFVAGVWKVVTLRLEPAGAM